MEILTLKAASRKATGTRATCNLRREGWVPAVLYGHGEVCVSIQVREEELTDLLREGHHMLALDLEGKQSHGLLKDIQYDTLGEHIMHVDFARVSLDEVITTSIPLRTIGTPKGLSAGGVLDVLHHELPVRGVARVLPEHFDLDIGELLLNQAIRAKELKMPEGVELALDAEEPIVIVHPPKADVVPVAAGTAEPELIGAKKEDATPAKPGEGGG